MGNTLFYILNTFLNVVQKWQTSFAVKVATWENTMKITVFHLFDNFPCRITQKMLMYMDWPYLICEKTLYSSSKCIPECSSKMSNKFTVIVAKWKILWKSLFFICSIMFLWTLPKNVDGFGWAILKLWETVYSTFEMQSWM